MTNHRMSDAQVNNFAHESKNIRTLLEGFGYEQVGGLVADAGQALKAERALLDEIVATYFSNCVTAQNENHFDGLMIHIKDGKDIDLSALEEGKP